MATLPVEALARGQAAQIASLVSMGAQSGATVLGLSAVRRAQELRLVFADSEVSANTLQELGRLTRSGARVFRVDGLEVVTRRMGRDDVHVLAVRSGPLAEGIVQRLPIREGS